MPKKSREQKRADTTRARAKKCQQRQAQRPAPSLGSWLSGDPFGDVPAAPPGFRPLPMTQAMLEFAAPLMDYVDQGTLQAPNAALQIGMQLWNYTLPTVPVAQRPSRAALVETIQTTLQLDRQEADAFVERMIARKAHLFPDAIQPTGSLTMFMRKEVAYLITPFAESQLQVSDTPLPPEEDDRPFLDALRQLEARIAAQVDYGAWEADFFAMEALCRQRYQHWLQAKGVPEPYSTEFPFCVETYLNFIYQYDAGTLRKVSLEALAEFFLDYLVRKVLAKPPEYTQWPPALRLFYRFLADKGYLEDPEPLIARLYAI